MKKLLISTLILMSASQAFTMAARRGAAVAAPIIAPRAAAQAGAPVALSLTDQIKAILAQITPGLAAVNARAEYIENAFNALSSGIAGQDLATLDINIKKSLVESCDCIYSHAQDLINELDPSGYPYWMKAPKSSTVKEMLALQDKVNNVKEQIEGPSNMKMLMKAIKYIGNHKKTTAQVVVALWAFNKIGGFKRGVPFVANNGLKAMYHTKDFLFKPIW